jgi:hypothetical protein
MTAVTDRLGAFGLRVVWTRSSDKWKRVLPNQSLVMVGNRELGDWS